MRTEILDISLRLEILCPSKSYTFGLVSMTWIETRIFKEFDSRIRELWT
jgi:hypothetical protein